MMRAHALGINIAVLQCVLAALSFVCRSVCLQPACLPMVPGLLRCAARGVTVMPCPQPNQACSMLLGTDLGVPGVVEQARGSASEAGPA
jgi:hypothetical protein